MKKLWETLTGFFARLFTRDFASKILAGIESASPYFAQAYAFVEIAAQMTPTRADDELVALANRLGVPALFGTEDKGVAISRIVLRALQMKYPGVPDRVLNRAIEIAYGALKP